MFSVLLGFLSLYFTKYSNLIYCTSTLYPTSHWIFYSLLCLQYTISTGYNSWTLSILSYLPNEIVLPLSHVPPQWHQPTKTFIIIMNSKIEAFSFNIGGLRNPWLKSLKDNVFLNHIIYLIIFSSILGKGWIIAL